MSAHVTELLALAAAGALDPAEAARVEAHLRECAACAAEAGGVAPPRGGARAHCPRRGRRARSWRGRSRPSRSAWPSAPSGRWNRAALGFLVAFAWTLAVVAWLLVDLVTGELALRLGPLDGARRPRGTRPT